jgi:hemoglobin
MGGDDAETVPTILDWGGGPEAFRRWLDVFYDLIEQESTIAPLFGGRVSEQHRAHAAAWWVEVMGGRADYAEQHGGYEAMLVHHRGLAITPEQRLRFVTY